VANGNFIPGNSLVNPQATHVVGFTPFIVDLTPYVKTDGTDNVLAVKVARDDAFFNSPDFSGAFRFGQADSGLFRPVWMYIKDRVLAVGCRPDHAHHRHGGRLAAAHVPVAEEQRQHLSMAAQHHRERRHGFVHVQCRLGADRRRPATPAPTRGW
jgi:hypothetical protein